MIVSIKNNHPSSEPFPGTEQPSPSAGVIRRIAAMLYDTMLMFGVLFSATLIPSLVLTQDAVKAVKNEEVVHELHPLMTGLPFQLYLLTLWVIFFCWFWHKNGQTLGMQAWRLKIEDINGSNISILQCLMRLLGASISVLCLGAGYWWIWIDKEGRSWHDHWSASRVSLIPKK